MAELAESIAVHTEPIRGDHCGDDEGFVREACYQAFRKSQEMFGSSDAALTAIGFWIADWNREPREIKQEIIDIAPAVASRIGAILNGVIQAFIASHQESVQCPHCGDWDEVEMVKDEWVCIKCLGDIPPITDCEPTPPGVKRWKQLSLAINLLKWAFVSYSGLKWMNGTSESSSTAALTGCLTNVASVLNAVRGCSGCRYLTHPAWPISPPPPHP